MSAPLSSDPKHWIDPWRAVRAQSSFAGEAAAEELPRLAQSLEESGANADWPARFSLRFGRDEGGRAVVSGHVSLVVHPICQRCLSPVALALDADLSAALIADEAQADDLPDHLDPTLVEDGRLRPLDLAEDELLLAVPLVPMHPEGACRSGYERDPDVEENWEQGERENPFAVLANLKRPRSGPEQ